MRHRVKAQVAGWAAAALVAAGCGGKAYLREGFLAHPPMHVAVLPFVITYDYDAAPGTPPPEAHAIGRDLLRKTFYYGLAPLHYHDIALETVDQALTNAWGPLESGAWQRASSQEIGRTVGAEALIYGEIQRIMHFSTPFYTETSLRTTLRMVDAATGEELWRKHVKVAERGGALVQKGQVADFVMDQVRSLRPEIKFLRIADIAVRKAIKELPNPPYVSDSADAVVAHSARKRLAVLPLSGKYKKAEKASGKLRQALAGDLQTGPFEVIELGAVDAALTAHGWSDGGPLPDAATLQQVAEALHADLLVRGRVTSWGRAYWVLESWVKAGMELELVDVKTGEVLWSDLKKRRQQAGILKGPTGYKSLVTAPITGLKANNLERVGTELARTMAEALMQSPAVLAYVHRDGAASISETPAPIQQ